MIEDGMRLAAGALGSPYETPALLPGATNLGFTLYPTYRLFVIVVCARWSAWRSISGRALAAGRAHPRCDGEPELTQAFGINTRRLVSGVFAFGVGAGGARRRAERAEHQRHADDGRLDHHQHVRDRRHRRFGLDPGFDRRPASRSGSSPPSAPCCIPPISNTLIFIVMVLVILFRPAGLFGTPEPSRERLTLAEGAASASWPPCCWRSASCSVHPRLSGFAIDLVCFALVAVAFDLLLGFTGLLSFGHAMFWGGAGTWRRS